MHVAWTRISGGVRATLRLVVRVVRHFCGSGASGSG